MLQVVSLGLGLLFTGINEVVFVSYQVAWYYFALQGYLIYGLIAVGLQANYAAASSPLPPLAAFPAALNQVEESDEEAHSLKAPPSATEQAPAGPAAPPAELLAQREQLVRFMEAEQPWLRPELTLAELARLLRWAPGVLSRVINTGGGLNFSDFVNGYRVRAAAQRLTDPRYAHYFPGRRGP